MKKWRLAALTAMAAMALAACGGSSEETTAAATEGAETEAAAEADTEAAAEETEAAEGAVWTFGGTGPLTGTTAIYGTAVMNGAQIAVDEINAAGGINGYQVNWIFEDDEAGTETAVNAYNALKDQGMQVMIGTTTSGSCMAVIAETETDNMFQITPSGTTADITIPANVYRMCFSDPAQGTKSAEFIATHELATKIGVIYDSSDTYSTGIYENFAAEAQNRGLEVVAVESFTSENKTDFRTQLQKIQDAGAELVFLPFYYTEASLVLRQADEMGFDPLFFGCDGMDGILTLPDFDTSLAEGLMLLTPFAADATDDLTVSFVTQYQEQFGEVPNQFAADAYDCVYVLKQAIELAGATPDMSVSDLCDAIVAQMGNVSYDGLTGAGIQFTEDGEPNKDPKAVVIENGAYVLMD
ncbi:MAG TPA: ABC transporter substrate-binding protein [Candidatus Avilachnospira avistercoris]|nr:ABC transporter substrate-binding protein [Candidatus Avilachnospira avistercoris]